MPHGDVLRPLTAREHLADRVLIEIGREPGVKAHDVAGKAFEHVHAERAQQGVDDRLVDLRGAERCR